MIARKYEVTPATARGWLKKSGIVLRSHRESAARANAATFSKPRPSKTELQSAFDEGLTTREMTERFKIAQCTVLATAREYGIARPTHQRRISNGKRKSFVARVAAMPNPASVYKECGFNFKATAARLGVPRTTLEAMFAHYGIETVIPWRSRGEIEIFDFLRQVDPEGDWQANDRTVLANRELDVVSHVRRLAVDYGSAYYHGETGRNGKPGRDRDYHRDKTMRALAAGYRLVTVFDYDDPMKVRRLLRAKLGLLGARGARECEVVEAGREGALFEEDNHLAGSTAAAARYALRLDGRVVSTMSFRRHPRHEWEIARYTIGDVSVTGGAARLLKRFVADHSPREVLTYSDLRFGDGSTYARLGFVREADAPPNYKYFKPPECVPYSRQHFQKHKLADRLESFDPALSEWENMRANGWDRVWDCGSARYVWKSHRS